MPIGIAFGGGFIPDERGAIGCYRLIIEDKELPGRWVCIGQRFLPAEVLDNDERGAGGQDEQKTPRSTGAEGGGAISVEA